MFRFLIFKYFYLRINILLIFNVIYLNLMSDWKCIKNLMGFGN